MVYITLSKLFKILHHPASKLTMHVPHNFTLSLKACNRNIMPSYNSIFCEYCFT